jgi:membrane fusion protein, multidrug efflux system
MILLRRILLIVLPIAIIGFGIVVAWTMVENRPEVETVIPEKPLPVVRLMTAEASNFRFRVHSQGSVRAKTQSAILSEVAGRVVWVSPNLASGAFFDEGELLVKVDPTDYELALLQAKTAIAEAEVRLEREKQEAAVARREWKALGQGTPSPLVLREPQLREAEALLENRKAAIRRAQIDLERTQIHAPYRGRVRQKLVDIGQFLNRGATIANIYGVDVAEVVLPVPNEDAAFLDLPMSYIPRDPGRQETTKLAGLPVRLFGTFAGVEHNWQGRIVRTEGEIDPQTRMMNLIAEVENPYQRGSANRPPLAVGMFIEAEITGRAVTGKVVIPRAALRAGDVVYVVDSQNRVDLRQVEILRAETDRVVLSDGIQPGERIVVSLLDAPVQGMQVRVAGESRPAPTEASR